MAAELVTVAIPVLNGGAVLGQTLDAVRAQVLDAEVELLVADSGSTDGSRARAEQAGARVIDVVPGEFSHGGTRNLLMEEAAGAHVAFLTQDATPAGPDWLARLLDGFALADDVALAFGPYIPRPDASAMVRRELQEFFHRLAPDGRPRAGVPDPFFTDANGCVARVAWEQVPFRRVSYAEDQMLARDMLAAGWSKAYVPAAGVLHSHDYGPVQLLRRSFDESRALREVQGATLVGGPVMVAKVVQRHVRDDLAHAGGHRLALAPRSLAHHLAKAVGATLGSRADRVPRRVRRLLSLEGRDGFEPQC